MILDAITSENHDDRYDVIMLTGDFNAATSQDTCFEKLNQYGFIDTITLKDTKKPIKKYDTWSNKNKYVSEEDDCRIDYVFIKPKKWYTKTEKKDRRLLGSHELAFSEKDREVSDHYGIAVTYEGVAKN
jgi:exonuclease III